MDYFYLITPVIIFSFMFSCHMFYKTKFPPHLSAVGHRFYYIDDLRGIAAILVVCSHSWRFRDIGFINDKITKADYYYMGNMGALGVQIFFCITGFLFFKKILDQGLDIDWKSFYVSRIKRLTPLYLAFCLCVVLVGMCVSGVYSFNSKSLTSLAKILSFGFMGANFEIVDYNSGYITPILWTLPYEWKFYFSIPFIAVCLSSRFSSVLFIMISILMYAMLSASDSFNIWVFFLTGGVAAYLCKFDLVKYKAPLMTLFYITLFAIIYSITLKDTPKYGFFRAVSTSLLFFLTVIVKPNIFRVKGLVYAGEISYGVYLFHLMIMFIFNSQVSRYISNHTIEPWVILSLACCYCFLLSILTSITFKYIEYPFMKKLFKSSP